MRNSPSLFWLAVRCAIALTISVSPKWVFAETLTIQSATRDRIAAECRRQYPSLLGDYLSRQACIDEKERLERGRLRQAQDEAERRRREQQASEERRRREEAVRPCIATALPTIEERLAEIRNQVNHKMTLDQVKEKLDPFFAIPGNIVVSEQDIFEKVYINYLRTPCQTDFYFLVNVSAYRDGNLRRLAVWSENPPMGYPMGLRAHFSRDLADERYEEEASARRIAAAERERQRQAVLQEERLRREADLQRRLEAIRRQLIITSRNVECPYSSNCDEYRVTVSVKNNSKETVRVIRFGFSIIPNSEVCPTNLSPRVDRRFTLQPGETGTFRLSSFDYGMPPAPPTRSFRYCVTIADAEFN